MKKFITKLLVSGFAFLAIGGMQVNAAKQTGSSATSNDFHGWVTYNYGVLSKDKRCEEAGGYSIINWEEDSSNESSFKLWFQVAGNGTSYSKCVTYHANFSFKSGTIKGKSYSLSGAREYPVDPETYVSGSWQV